MNFRKWFFILPVFFVGTLFAATTYTTRAGIPKPADSDTGWGTTLRSAFDVIDSSMCALGGSNYFSGSNRFFNGAIISSGTTLSLYNTAGNGIAYLQNAGSSGRSEMNIISPDGVGINNSAQTGVSLMVWGENTDVLHGSFAVMGSSANASAAYSGFIATSPIDASTLWSLPKKDGTANQPIVTDGSAHLSFSNQIAISTLTLTGYAKLASKTAAEIRSLTPSTVAQYFYCSDCSAVTTCVSTGTAAGAWALITARTSACQ